MAIFTLMTGDVSDWAKQHQGPKFHAMLSDFPYDLGFMGKTWDMNAQFNEWGRALLPVLHPGAIALVFGATRTWHRLATGLEDAGWEIWDTILWLYATGFPKGQEVSRLAEDSSWNGYRTTAFKPCWEPIICLKRPLVGTYREAAATGVGALNIEACRIGTAADMNPKDFDDSRRTSPKFSGILNSGKEGQFRSGWARYPMVAIQQI